MEFIFATRPSALARWQTRWVIQALQDKHPNFSFREQVISTQGDRILDRPLPEIGGKGLFTLELEEELLSGQVHAAVHSLKDLPVDNPPGLTIGAVPPRAEVRDALVSYRGETLSQLPYRARVGTSSLRRAAQLLALRPDLTLLSLRGNVDTRLRKVHAGEYDAIILAGAGLVRLDLQDKVSEWLPLEQMLPAPGQGALAVQCRSDDEKTLELLKTLEDGQTRQATTAERAFLAALGGGCAVPVAAYAHVHAGELHLEGLVAALDGTQVIRVQRNGEFPEELGAACAQEAIDQGASQILKSTAANQTGN
jgi:hydroxymethylbilane synthase